MSKPDLATAVEEIMEVRDDLCNGWEWDFIGDMQVELDKGHSISEKQENAIWNIYRKASESNL